MFTGIVRATGRIKQIHKEKENMRFSISTSLIDHLKPDQSVAHNGVCLTVTDVNPQDKTYTVTAIKETLQRTNLGFAQVGENLNLELCMLPSDRLDGHIVQGHVDCMALCRDIKDHQGSFEYFFLYEGSPNRITVEKGSICVNGVSLTVAQSGEDNFSVAIIPYTYQNTNFRDIKVNSKVNLEFDIVGKYIAKLHDLYKDEKR